MLQRYAAVYHILGFIICVIVIAIDMTDECKAVVAALLPTLGGVDMPFLPGFAVNTSTSSEAVMQPMLLLTCPTLCIRAMMT